MIQCGVRSDNDKNLIAVELSTVYFEASRIPKRIKKSNASAFHSAFRTPHSALYVLSFSFFISLLPRISLSSLMNSLMSLKER